MSEYLFLSPPLFSGDAYFTRFTLFLNQKNAALLTFGNHNKKPTVSVKNPGVKSKAPANKIIAPCTIGSVGFSN